MKSLSDAFGVSVLEEGAPSRTKKGQPAALSAQEGFVATRLGLEEYLSKKLLGAGKISRSFARRRAGSPRVRALVHRLLAARQFRLVNGPLVLDLESRRMMLGAYSMSLPARERSILLVLLARTGKTISKQTLARMLCVGNASVSANAIENYIARLRKRLAPGGIVIRTVSGRGYALEPFAGEQLVSIETVWPERESSINSRDKLRVEK